MANVECTLKTSLCFKFKDFILSPISSYSNIFGMKLGISEVLFVSASSGSSSFGYSGPGVWSFSIWLCGLAIVNQFFI